MSITWITGNIFTSQAQTLVNTVNCVGVMGAGIALECRLRYPEMFERYAALCDSGQLRPGLLWLHKGDDRWILNFPTKDHWKAPSQESYLTSGLQKFVETYRTKGIKSIAFPLLGADHGGIAPESSKRILERHLADLPIPIEIYSYDPTARDDLFEAFGKWLSSGGAAVLRSEYKIREDILQRILRAVQTGEVAQLNQLGRIKGIGVKSLERVFRASRAEMHHPTQGGLELSTGQ